MGDSSIRRLRRGTAVTALLVCSLALGAGSVLAQPVTVPTTEQPLPGSQFQGADGNQDDTATLIDWQGLQADERVEHTSDPNEHDNIFAGGSKELEPGDWGLTTENGGANPKEINILDSYSAIDRPLGSDVFVYLAFTREAHEGTSFLTFELNQDRKLWKNPAGFEIPCRKTGDVLISFEPHGTDTEVHAERWETDTEDPSTHCAITGDLKNAPGLKPQPDPLANVQAAFNGSTIANYLPGFYATTIPGGNFGEAAINLSSVLASLGEPCQVFASTWMHSRSSSSSENAALKDYVAPRPFRLSTCKASPKLSTVASGRASRRARGNHRATRHRARRASGPVRASSARARPARGKHRAPRHRAPRHRAVGGIYDTAHLSGGAEATGTITFNLYGPSDPTCTGTPAFVYTSEVIGDGYYRSGEFMPTAAGTYRWVVDYSGDRDNSSASTKCGDEEETILFTPAPEPSQPTLSTSVGVPGRIAVRRRIQVAGRSIFDTATLSGGFNPTGFITFSLYGPNDATCTTTPIFTTATTVNGNGIYNSERTALTEPGVYRLVAKYSGDANNHPAGPTPCGDIAEQVLVTDPAQPQLTSSASQAVTIGGAIHDTAHLSGGSNPGGTITFQLYGPANSTCAGAPAFTSTVAVAGNGDHISQPFVPVTPGGYRWIVSYSGDSHNHPAGPTACGDSAELVIVRPASITPVVPAFSTTASQPTGVGMPVYDIAHLSDGIDPSGTITFSLFGPVQPNCMGPPVFTATAAVTGNGEYRSASFIAPQPGTYRWVVTYSGDALNSGAGPTVCGESAESATVAATPGPNADPGPNVAAPRPPKPQHSVKPLRRSRSSPPPPPVTG
jgi:hypothetical protein